MSKGEFKTLDAMRLVPVSALSPNAKHIAHLLLLHADNVLPEHEHGIFITTNCFPSLETLAQESGRSRRAVWSALVELRDEPIGAPVRLTWKSTGGRHSNRYTLHLNSAPTARINGATTARINGATTARSDGRDVTPVTPVTHANSATAAPPHAPAARQPCNGRTVNRATAAHDLPILPADHPPTNLPMGAGGAGVTSPSLKKKKRKKRPVTFEHRRARSNVDTVWQVYERAFEATESPPPRFPGRQGDRAFLSFEALLRAVGLKEACNVVRNALGDPITRRLRYRPWEILEDLKQHQRRAAAKQESAPEANGQVLEFSVPHARARPPAARAGGGMAQGCVRTTDAHAQQAHRGDETAQR